MTQHPDPIVSIAPGRVRGSWRDGSAAFLGIPFAQAPVGDLRFAAPVPPEPWDGVRDALAYGATAKREKPGETTLIPEPAIPGDATLNVNVFTPAPGDAAAALPVLVYIHGGGFIEGSPASPWYDGAAFNRDGVVTVTVSYRLGFDGFGHIAGRAEQPRRARLARRTGVGAREHRGVRRRPRPRHDRRAVRRRRRRADAARDAGCPGPLPRGLGAVAGARGRAGRTRAHALRQAREPRRRRADARRIRVGSGGEAPRAAGGRGQARLARIRSPRSTRCSRTD